MSLKPLLPSSVDQKAAVKLASRSNYEHYLAGDSSKVGLSYNTSLSLTLEQKRSSHKVAEKKRRDSLKKTFEELKLIVPRVDEVEDGEKKKGKPAGLSKISLLRHGMYEVDMGIM